MSDRPTDKAIKDFGRAANKSYLAATMKDPVQLAMAVNALADGLIDLATGLRATYIANDEVKGLLQQRKGQAGGVAGGAAAGAAAGVAAGLQNGGASMVFPSVSMLPAIKDLVAKEIRDALKK